MGELRQKTVDVLRKVLPEALPTPVIDLGGGARHGWLEGVLARQDIGSWDAVAGPGVDRVVDGCHMPEIADGQVGTLISNYTLEHVAQPFNFATEVARVVFRHGVLFVSTVLAHPLHGPGEDNWRFSVMGLQHLFGRDFSEIASGIIPCAGGIIGTYFCGRRHKGTNTDFSIAALISRAKCTRMQYSRLQALHALASQWRRIDGAFVECGCWRGGSAAVIADAIGVGGREVFLLDSFQGMPEPEEVDGLKAREKWDAAGSKWCACEPEDVYRTFEIARLLKPTIVKGWFNETVPKLLTGPIAVLHLDGDFYESTKVCFTHFYPKLIKGGLLILDDYGHWPGARKATDEYLGMSKEKLRHLDYESVYLVKETDG